MSGDKIVFCLEKVASDFEVIRDGLILAFEAQGKIFHDLKDQIEWLRIRATEDRRCVYDLQASQDKILKRLILLGNKKSSVSKKKIRKRSRTKAS